MEHVGAVVCCCYCCFFSSQVYFRRSRGKYVSINSCMLLATWCMHNAILTLLKAFCFHARTTLKVNCQYLKTGSRKLGTKWHLFHLSHPLNWEWKTNIDEKCTYNVKKITMQKNNWTFPANAVQTMNSQRERFQLESLEVICELRFFHNIKIRMQLTVAHSIHMLAHQYIHMHSREWQDELRPTSWRTNGSVNVVCLVVLLMWSVRDHTNTRASIHMYTSILCVWCECIPMY